MNKEQKEILQSQLNNEKKTIGELKQVYGQALKDVNQKIRELSSRTDMENLQSIIYQKQYQEALKAQLEGVLTNLQSNEYSTVSDYLTRCYQEGFVGVAYELKSQGIPMILPIDQSQVTKAIQTDSKISVGLYTRLGEDVKKLKTSIRAELSRGIANGSSWNEIAEKISGSMKNSPFQTAMNNSIRIARTEGHRVQVASAVDAQHAAKEKGADVVKQWDATMDGATRETHRELDGKIAEVDEEFEYSGGTVSAPSHFGDPSEDCNCRCALLTRARWALDEAELEELKKRAEYFGLDKTKDFADFKSKFLNAGEFEQKMKMSEMSGMIEWTKEGTKISPEQYKNIMSYAREKGINLSGFKMFDGDYQTLVDLVDDAHSVVLLYPEIVSGKKSLVIELDSTLRSCDFASTTNHIIRINANAYRDIPKLQEEYDKLVESGWFVAGTDYHAIIKHEIGHVYGNKHNIDAIDISKQVTGIESTSELMLYLEENLSEYASEFDDGSEITSEVFSALYGSSILNEFALKFMEYYGSM